MPAPTRRPPPCAQLQAGLAAGKRAGLDFEEAWEVSLRAVIWPHDTGHRRQWREALKWTRPEWEACYAGVETGVARFFRNFPPSLLSFEGDDTTGLEVAAA